MFMLAFSSPGEDRDPSGFRAGLAVNYRAIYSNHESAASSFPHPGCSDLMMQALGEAGRHSRSALGIAALHSNVPVVIDAIFELAYGAE